MNLLIEQLNFSKTDAVHELIESQKFSEAFDLLESYLGEKQGDETIYRLMKQIRFWIKRMDRIDETEKGKTEENQFLIQSFSEYDFFIKKYELYQEKEYHSFKKSIFNKVIDNHIYLFHREDKNHHENIFQLVQLLIELQEYDKAEETLIYLRKTTTPHPQIDFALANVFYYQNKERQAILHIKDSFFWHDYLNYQLIRIKTFYPLINRMFSERFNETELSLWLPVYAKIEGLIDANSLISQATFKKMIDRVKVIKNKHERYKKKSNIYEPKLLFSYLFVLDQLFLRIQKGFKYFTEDVETILHKIAHLNHNIYEKIKNHYE